MDNIKAVFRMIKQLNYILSKQQKKKACYVFVVMLFGSFFELISVAALLPFLQLMTQPDEVANKWYIKVISYIKPGASSEQTLLIVGIAIILVFVIKNVFLIYSAYVQNEFSATFQKEYSTLMLVSFFKRPYEYFLNTEKGVIFRGISSDVGGVYYVILNFFSLASECINILLIGIYLIMIDVQIALGALFLALICLLAVVVGFKSKMKTAGERARYASFKMSQCSNHAIDGIKEITVADRKDRFAKKYEDASEINRKATITNTFLSACPDRILEGICIGGFMGIVCIKIIYSADLSSFIPILGTFAMAAFKILPSFSKISSRINSLVFYQNHLLSTYENLKEARKYEKSIEKYSKEILSTKADEPIKFRSELVLKDVMWHYQDRTENVLDHVTLTIKKGESVAFIGPSGAGKTTTADVIMGLFRPQGGTVEMDGIDIFAMPHQWAKIIGYVPQSVYLIADTIRNNIAFGLNSDEIDDDKIWAALEKAQLKEFVKNLPEGLETIVGERGVKLSGGQRQRVAIARALYEDPDILVLDEATSALDNETEAAVMESIDALQGDKTLIIIAHRLSTIKKCDKIYEIKDGVATIRNKEEVIK